MLTRLIVMFLLAVGVSAKTSQPPAPGSRDTNRQAQQALQSEPQPAQPGQNQTPIVVNVTLPEPKAPKPPPKGSADRYGTVADWWMVGLTFLSLAATVVLVVIALRQFVKQTQQTTKALALARQANRTANAALDATVMMTKEIERAYVDVSLVDVPVGIRNLTPGVAPSVMLKVENCGRTPGQLIATVTGLVGYVDGLPAVPVYETVPPSPATGYMMPGGCVYIVKDLHPMAAEVLDGVEAGRQKLWLVGYVRYRDRFERTHQRGFIRRYVPKRTPEQWIMDDTPGYDYDRAITDDSNA